MKLKSIASLCKSRKTADICTDTYGNQYLGNWRTKSDWSYGIYGICNDDCRFAFDGNRWMGD